MADTRLLLAREGIFPITRDRDGRPLPHLPSSGFPFPGTVQGEGKLAGIPSLFVRLAGCNLHCEWPGSPCDTAHASFRPAGTYSLPVQEVAEIIQQNRGPLRHLVITGGEPLLQPEAVEELCLSLVTPSPFHVTVESNATRYDERVAAVTDLMSLSPKLSTSAPATRCDHHARRLAPDVIQRYITHARRHGKDFQLKFVISAARDVQEVQELLATLHDWQNEDILLMPLGTTPATLHANSLLAAHHAILRGWRYCDRLHISLFGNREGV
jgi:7-carboxy-7-deazaguanine synthase